MSESGHYIHVFASALGYYLSQNFEIIYLFQIDLCVCLCSKICCFFYSSISYSDFFSANLFFFLISNAWCKLTKVGAEPSRRTTTPSCFPSRMVCRPRVKVSTCTNIPGTNSMTTDTRWPPRPAFTGSCLWSLKWQMNIAWSLTRQLGLAEICKLFFCGTMVLKWLQTFPLPFSFIKAIDFLLWSAVFPWIKTI